MAETIYERFQKIRAAQEAAYAELAKSEGRLVIAPSGRGGGVYLKDEKAKPAVQISNIERDEAQFIVDALTEIYGL